MYVNVFLSQEKLAACNKFPYVKNNFTSCPVSVPQTANLHVPYLTSLYGVCTISNFLMTRLKNHCACVNYRHFEKQNGGQKALSVASNARPWISPRGFRWTSLSSSSCTASEENWMKFRA